MGEGAASTGTMPVFLVRFGCHAVPPPAPLRAGAARLYPANALDDVQQLATTMGVPVIPNAGFESNNRSSCRERRRRPQERGAGRLSGKGGRLQRIEITLRLGSRGNVHPTNATPGRDYYVMPDQGKTKRILRRRQRIGPFLCWAVVFADIGTSVYYTPGILYGRFGTRAAIFVAMTLLVFVLLAIKYAEVAIRYPEGGGVVTVSTRAFHPFVGLVGGMFILVDYFLTAALSALSGVIYLSVVFKSLGTVVVLGTVGGLVILALLNLVGVKASAEASAIFAVIAGVLQVAVVAAVIVHLAPAPI